MKWKPINEDDIKAGDHIRYVEEFTANRDRQTMSDTNVKPKLYRAEEES
jgi:hypothetical protein